VVCLHCLRVNSSFRLFQNIILLSGLFDVIQNDILGDEVIAPYRLANEQEMESQRKVSALTPTSSKPTNKKSIQLTSQPPTKHKQVEEQNAEQDTKRKRLSVDPADNYYDEELALQEAIKLSQDVQTKVTDLDVQDEDKEFQEVLKRSLEESKGFAPNEDDDDEDFKMALQLSLQDR
jgi:hypothetical protein